MSAERRQHNIAPIFQLYPKNQLNIEIHNLCFPGREDRHLLMFDILQRQLKFVVGKNMAKKVQEVSNNSEWDGIRFKCRDKIQKNHKNHLSGNVKEIFLLIV